MALGVNTVFEARTTATAANVNGAGFDPEVTGANLLADLTTDTNTGNTASPIVSSASYNFVAGDVNAYVFIQSGTNWLPGWYKISSVAANKATLDASVGAVVKYTSGVTRTFTANTVVGIASVGTPTGGVFAVDYSQQDAAIISLSDLACTTPSVTVTSATGSFTPAMVGNLLHINTAISGSGGLTGWFEIVKYNSATSVDLDRTPSPSASGTGGVFHVGGAASLNSSAGATDDAFFELGTGTNGTGASVFFIKNGTFASMGTISIAASGGTQTTIRVLGYNTIRSDGFAGDLGANRPTLAMGANAFAITGSNWTLSNLSITGTSAALVSLAGNCTIQACKVVNSSVTAARQAVSMGNAVKSFILASEIICYRGFGIASAGGTSLITIQNSYIHDCNIGLTGLLTSGAIYINGCIFADNISAALSPTGALSGPFVVTNTTLYGAENKLGTGILMVSGTTTPLILNNCILYGFVTPISFADPQNSSMGDYNNYFNNTNGNTNFPLGVHDIALNPGFVDASQYTGTGATSSTNVLTDSGAAFTNVVDNQDFLVITSGSGTGLASSVKLLITSHTATTLTVSSNITSSGSGSSLVYQVSTGHNYAVGQNMAAAGYPGVFPASLTTGYIDIGAAQRRSSGRSAFTFVG